MIERLIPFVLLGCSLLNIQYLVAEPVPVRHVEGLVHGFLLLRTLDGKTIAQGDLTEIANGEQVTAHLVFHFTDGSLHEETAVFSQSHIFHLLKDHLVQKGSTFKASAGYVDRHRKTGGNCPAYRQRRKGKTTTEQMDLPADLANGMTLTCREEFPADRAENDGVHDRCDSKTSTRPSRYYSRRRGIVFDRRFPAEGSPLVKVEVGGVSDFGCALIRQAAASNPRLDSSPGDAPGIR
jgi:hypothetical protein